MHEASKTKAFWSESEVALLQGKGIDIGCGPDPITPDVRRFDMEDGDANEIGKFVHEQFDFVFSAHCLEHMVEPEPALLGWWNLVRPGGHLIFLVPDEDLYEQGYWPSLFNTDHKATFTLKKQHSWSRRSFNVIDLVNTLPEADPVSVNLHDRGYDRRILQSHIYPRFLARFLGRGFGVLGRAATRIRLGWIVRWLVFLLRVPIDQTELGAFAQIQAIVKKREPSTT